MQKNNAYPWYLQKSPVFTKIYDGMYEVAKNISCLDIGDFFNYNALPVGTPLATLARVWNVGSVLGYYDGLIYDVDSWSTDKKWTGTLQTLDESLTRNFLQMKMYIQGKQFSLTMIKEALDILLQGVEYTASVTESSMSFVINISAPTQALSIIQAISGFDNVFLGKPSGISYTFAYTATDA